MFIHTSARIRKMFRFPSIEPENELLLSYPMRRWYLLVAALFLISCFIGAVNADVVTETIHGEFAPADRSFFIESTPDASADENSPCCGSGPLRISPLDLSHLDGKKIHAEDDSDLKMYAQIEEELPSRYDLRDYQKVPPVRDQGQSGSCWDFSAIKSLESSFLPALSQDFSENNLKNHVSAYYPEGFDFADGGNDLMAAAYVNRWAGPVPERLDPYNPYSFKSPDNLPVVAHVPDIPMLPGRSNPLDNDNIKNGLMQFGNLYTTLSFDNSYYNAAKAAYYNPNGKTPDHAVNIIGWDDNYPRTNFLQEAPGDGAFICANSWGVNWGEQGFFYVSYYDILIGKRVSAFTGSPSDDFDGNYGYDPLGWVSSFGFGYEEASGANVFRAEANEVIEAVGFYIPQVNTAVSVGVYIDPTDGPVSAKGPDSYDTTSFQIPGYHIFKLENPVSVKKGQNFSIEVLFLTPDYGFPVPVEYAYPGYSTKATASPGQSYVKAPKGAWSDLTAWDSTANVCIRAYTKRTTGPKAAFYGDPVSGTPPLSVQFTDISTGSPERWLWQFGDGATSTEQHPVHTYTQEGLYMVSLTVDRLGGESKAVIENYISTIAPDIITVPDDHSLIQAALNAAREGATIKVRYGYYPEQITITKPVTLVGESNPDGQKPIIDAQYAGTPVSITASKVTVENFSITGAWSSTAIRPAVAVRGNNARILRNWIFENYAGIRCESSDLVVIDGNVIWNSTAEAIFTETSSDIGLYNNTVLLTSSAPAVRLVNGQRAIIRGNVIADNGDAGLELHQTQDLTVYDNYFNNLKNTRIGSDVQGTWNREKSSGINIVGGPYIGGNYWANPYGTGFSETHPDQDGDGFCDEPFIFDGQTDTLPLASQGEKTVVAEFEALPKTGSAPLSVRFYDFSTGPVDSWTWSFGDGGSSTEQEPVHLYYLPGTYPVSLTVSGAGSTHTNKKPDFISVTGDGPNYRLSLASGWNLVTTPKQLLSGSNAASLFAEVDSAGHSMFTFSESSWALVKRDDVITPLVGYWIYAKSPVTISLYFEPISGIPEKSVQVGWNCIGSPGKNPVSAKTAMESLGNTWVYLLGFDRTLQKYDDIIIRGGSGQYADDRLLKPGFGYWLFMEKGGVLRGVYTP
jgi:C1A family cysteine protease/PKD repeat protein